MNPADPSQEFNLGRHTGAHTQRCSLQACPEETKPGKNPDVHYQANNKQLRHWCSQWILCGERKKSSKPWVSSWISKPYCWEKQLGKDYIACFHLHVPSTPRRYLLFLFNYDFYQSHSGCPTTHHWFLFPGNNHFLQLKHFCEHLPLYFFSNMFILLLVHFFWIVTYCFPFVKENYEDLILRSALFTPFRAWALEPGHRRSNSA